MKKLMREAIDSTAVCANCEAKLSGQFCSVCGQKKIEDKERTFKHFIYQFFGVAFFLENNFFKNLLSLSTKPGQMAVDFVEGRRKRWMPPFSLFLLINLVYFMVSPLSDFNLSLKEQLNQPYAKVSRYLTNKVLERKEMEMEKFEDIYKNKSSNLSNSLIVLHAPILALLIFPLFRKRRIFYSDHFIFSLYFLAFLLLAILIQYLLILGLAGFGLLGNTMIKIITIIWFGSLLIYLIISIKRIYREAGLLLYAKSLMVLISFIFTHFIYRFLLYTISIISLL